MVFLRRHSSLVSLIILAITFAGQTYAGPPFVTDDPEPVDLHHWEINLAAQQSRSAGSWSGTAPLLEVNYGAIPDVQLHFIAPFTYDKPADGSSHYGYGDTELGVKYRFIHETDDCPQVAIFPAIELPSGNNDKGLGNGKAQVFLPIWLEKKFGDWTTYGGGGYWYNPGEQNRNYWYAGWEVQRKLTESFTTGLEVQYRTADAIDARSSCALNAGGMLDLSETYHVLFSAGHTVSGASEFQAYLSLLITLGPQDEKVAAKK